MKNTQQTTHKSIREMSNEELKTLFPVSLGLKKSAEKDNKVATGGYFISAKIIIDGLIQKELKKPVPGQSLTGKIRENDYNLILLERGKDAKALGSVNLTCYARFYTVVRENEEDFSVIELRASKNIVLRAYVTRKEIDLIKSYQASNLAFKGLVFEERKYEEVVADLDSDVFEEE